MNSISHSPSYFYGLPKVHKSCTITNDVAEQKNEYVLDSHLNFLPIVAELNSAIQRLNHILDLVSNSICTQVSSFIKADMIYLGVYS